MKPKLKIAILFVSSGAYLMGTSPAGASSAQFAAWNEAGVSMELTRTVHGDAMISLAELVYGSGDPQDRAQAL